MSSVIMNNGDLTVEGSTTLAATAIVDGTQGSGKVLTSDANGNVSWAARPTSSLTETAVDYVALPGDDVIVVTVDGKNVTLPTAAGIAGKVYTIKFTDVYTSGCTVIPDGLETIDGVVSYALSAQYKFVQIISDGTGWLIIGKN